MKSHTTYLKMNVPERMGFVNITGRVADAVRDSAVREGLCLVNAMHITASVFVNDDEPGLLEDYKRWLEQLAGQHVQPVSIAHLQKTNPREWARQFDAWVNSHDPKTPVLSDEAMSRESIYTREDDWNR